MAYDAETAARLGSIVRGEPGLSERSMFGGYAFLVHGHLAVAAGGQGGLLLRADPDRSEELLAADHVTRFVMRGRELTGWFHVAPEAITTDEELERWAEVGLSYVRSLPPK